MMDERLASMAPEELRSAMRSLGYRTQNDLADRVVEAIASAAQTGRIGDGKIFVSTIDSALRIRTGERDDAAL